MGTYQQDQVTMKDGSIVLYRRLDHQRAKWQMRIRLPGIQAHNGYRKSTGTFDLDEARAVALNTYNELKFKLEYEIPVFDKTLSDIIKEFIQEKTRLFKLNHVTEHQMRYYKRALRYWEEYLGKKDMTKITANDITQYIEWRGDYWTIGPGKARRAKTPTARDTPSDRTLEWEYSALRAVFNWAGEKGYINVQKMPTINYRAKERDTRPALTLEQYIKLRRFLRPYIHAYKDKRIRDYRRMLSDYIQFMIGSGLRVGEARQLRWMDIEPFVDEAGHSNVIIMVSRSGKTGRRDVVPLYHVRYVLEIRRKLSKYTDPTDYIFANQDNGKSIGTFHEGFKNLIVAAGVDKSTDGENITIYSLRHSYITFQIRYGKTDPFTLASNSGNSIETIQKWYNKVRPRDKAAGLASPKEPQEEYFGARKFDRLLDNNPSKIIKHPSSG